MASQTLSDILWRYFRYAKFLFMLIALWIGVGVYTSCMLKQVPLQNHQMTPTFTPEKLLWVDPKTRSQETGLKQGDPVLYRFIEEREAKEERIFMGRIVAFGGERVKVDKGDIFVNGKKQSESAYLSKESREEFDLQEMVVPRGYVYLLVDNRTAYKQFRYQTRVRDSRHFGPILENAIIGKITSSSKLKSG